MDQWKELHKYNRRLYFIETTVFCNTWTQQNENSFLQTHTTALYSKAPPNICLNSWTIK